MSSSAYEIAHQTFERIEAAFPNLAMNIETEPEGVALSMSIAAQPGLLFDVRLNLQNSDELHLCASSLWVEWLPCTDPQVVDSYVDAVSGLLSGRFRIVEHIRGQRTVRAELQRPSDDSWETISRWSTLSLPWPRKSQRVVQNVSASQKAAVADTQPHTPIDPR